MNFQHLKYVVEIEKTSSITKAAQNLYMGQPNLSRAIKELEQLLGVKIFKRTSKGIEPTQKGKEFIRFARGVIIQIEEAEKYFKQNLDTEHFSISIVRDSSLVDAFNNTIQQTLQTSDNIHIQLKEAGNLDIIDDVSDNRCGLGIIEFDEQFCDHFRVHLQKKELEFRNIGVFKKQIIISKNSPILTIEKPDTKTLDGFVNLQYGDYFIPTFSDKDDTKTTNSSKNLFVFDRATAYQMLSQNHNTFMYSGDITPDDLDRYNLTVLNHPLASPKFERFLIYRKEHHFNTLEEKFIRILQENQIEL